MRRMQPNPFLFAGLQPLASIGVLIVVEQKGHCDWPVSLYLEG